MPEGPETRRAADQLARALTGQEAISVELHVPRLAHLGAGLSGQRILRVDARSKAMLIRFCDGRTLYSHNQLYGRWSVVRAGRDVTTRRALRVAIRTRTHAALLYSATEIELLDDAGVASHPYLSRLGVELLDPATVAGDLVAVAGQARQAGRTLAALLLDQGFYAGLGNYLRSEILYVARLRHDMKLRDLDADQRRLLAHTALALTRQAYRTRGVTNDAARVRELKARGLGFAAYRHRVFDREGLPCWECASMVARIDVAGRGIYYCPGCQDYGARRPRAVRARRHRTGY